VLSRNERLYVDIRESQFFEIVTSDEFAELANHSPQRFGLALASLRQQRNASAAPHSGDNSAVVPPVPIPNTAVKRCSPDGSTATGRARVGRRQNKNPGEFIIGVFAFWRRLLEQRTRRAWNPSVRWSNPRVERTCVAVASWQRGF